MMHSMRLMGSDPRTFNRHSVWAFELRHQERRALPPPTYITSGEPPNEVSARSCKIPRRLFVLRNHGVKLEWGCLDGRGERITSDQTQESRLSPVIFMVVIHINFCPPQLPRMWPSEIWTVILADISPTSPRSAKTSALGYNMAESRIRTC